MKYNNKYTLRISAIIVAALLLSNACKREDYGSYLRSPKADFTVLQSDPNNIILLNNSSVSSAPFWSISEIGYTHTGDSAKVYFPFAGTYHIKLLSVGTGNIDSLTKTVTIAASDPTACSSSKPQGFIAGCTSKTWKMNPADKAFWVSQFAGGEGSWWASDASTVTSRPCAFNDTYTFSFNLTGDFVFDDKGDFFGDGYLGDNSSNCQPSSNYTDAEKPWSSGNFSYEIIPNAGVKGLGQLKLKGIGAHIGVQKAINNNETPDGATASSITYDIWSMEHVTDPGGDYDLLTLTFHYGGWSPTDGWWTFTLRSY
jgi:hypothetical protein